LSLIKRHLLHTDLEDDGVPCDFAKESNGISVQPITASQRPDALSAASSTPSNP
jgi:hypothetical protein